MLFVYVIQNSAGKIYIGQTCDIEKRMLYHNGILKPKNKSFTHKQGGQWKVVYFEEFSTRGDAMKRERQLKSSRGRVYIKEVIAPIA